MMLWISGEGVLSPRGWIGAPAPESALGVKGVMGLSATCGSSPLGTGNGVGILPASA